MEILRRVNPKSSHPKEKKYFYLSFFILQLYEMMGVH